MRKIIPVLLFFYLLLLANIGSAQNACIPNNMWFEPKTGELYSPEDYLKHIPSSGIILLGEHHENTAHHVWQLEVLKAMHKKQPKLAIGLEMFPQNLQHILDDWVASKIDTPAFIQLSQWDEIWAYDFNDYLPLFQFARDNRIPLVAINVQKALMQMVRNVGWKNIPENHREGITAPATPSKDYIRQLVVSFRRHLAPSAKINKQSFSRFVEQQLLWDRAMAHGLAKRAQEFPLVVGLLGSWHVINGFGVPHQLRDLGADKITSFVPWDEHLNCSDISDQFADAIYGTPIN